MAALAVCGALSGLLTVALGAFGGHALEGRVPAERLAVYRTGVHYQMFHTVAVFVALLAVRAGLASPLALWSGWLWLAGILLFSGSLYALTVTGRRRLGAVTPVGGLLLLAGWAMLVVAAAAR